MKEKSKVLSIEFDDGSLAVFTSTECVWYFGTTYISVTTKDNEQHTVYPYSHVISVGEEDEN